MKHLRIIVGALLLALLTFANPAAAAVDMAICSAADQSGCTGTNLKVNGTEELGALQNRAPLLLTSISGTNAITACSTPAITAYGDGMTVHIKPPANNTSAVTFNFCGVGSVAATSLSGTALSSGDLLSTNIYLFRYFAANNQWRALSPLGGGAAIGANSVANSQLAQMPASTVKCNPTGALANATDCTLGTNLSFAGSVINATGGGGGGTPGGTTGQIQYNNAGAFAGFTASGDITITPSTGATAIAANAVTNAKAAQMPANTFKANNTGSTANAGDITAAQAKALLAISNADVSGLGSLATASSVNLSTQATGTLQAAQAPALSGDVTSTAGSLATTIASASVSNAKLATVAANSIKGNNTGSVAAPADLTVAQVNAMLNATAAPIFTNVTSRPTTRSGYGITDAEGTFTSTRGLTADAGAASLTKTSNYQYFEFTTSGSPGTTGFTLPTSTGAARLIVNNATANSLLAFPPTGGTLDGAAVNASVLHPANSIVTYISVDGSNNWTTIRPSAGGGSGTVTSASIVTANGFAGTTATPGSTPAHTISTTVTGIVKGNGTALSAATAGTDYLAPFASQTANTFYAAPNGAAGVPAFRAVVAADIPTLNQNTTGTAASVTGTNVVANSNLAQMPATTFKGNNTGATANVADLTAAQVKTALAIANTDVSGLGALATASSVNLSTQATGTLQAAQFPAMTGDVTSTAGALGTTIAANAVTNAKAAQMAAGTVKANVTGATANATDATPSAVLDVIGSTRGALLMRGASGWTALAPSATTGQVLQSNGTGADPSYVTLAGGGNALTTNPLSQFAATTSAQLAGVISDETGSGALQFANTSTLGITANAGASALTKTSEFQYFEITTSGSPGTTGFTLPASAGPSARLVVDNKTANSLLVFPPTGGTLDGAVANASVLQAGNSIVTYYAVDASGNYRSDRFGKEPAFTSTLALTAAVGGAVITRTSDYQYVEVTTSGSPGTTGFTLPTSSTGSMRLVVNNKTANSIFMFPPTGGTLDGAAVNASVLQAANSIVTYYSIDNLNYQTIRHVTNASLAGGTLPGSFTTLAATSMDSTPIGATTASTGRFSTLTATGAVTLSPASAAVAISPTGTGTVAISPVGALTINPTAASTINNASIGATTASTGRFTTLTTTGAVTLSPANAAVTLSPTGTGNVVIAPATAGTINNMSLGATTPSTVKATSYALTNLVNNTTAPTVTGFCTSPTVPASNGNTAFTINVGTACAASTGTITLPAATNGWICDAHDVTTPASNIVEMTGGTTTTVTLQNYARTTGVAANFTSSDVLRVKCSAY